MRPHGPNKLGAYIDIHTACMQRFLRNGFVLEDTCEFSFLPGIITLTGQVRCLGNIELHVKKKIDILSGDGLAALVQRSTYNYHAQFCGGDCHILRYDWPGHRPHHHKHIFDHFGTWCETAVQPIDEDDTPTMGAVIMELQAWYWDNVEAINRMQQ